MTAIRRASPTRWSREDRSTFLWAMLFLSPWIIGFVVFTAIPMLWSLFLSFTSYSPLTGNAPLVGLANYQRIPTDPTVTTALWNTMYFTVLFVPLSTILSIFLASLLNRIGNRTSGFFRTAFYLPNITPAVATGTLFILVLANPDGLLNSFLRFFGITVPTCLNDPAWLED